MTDEEQKNYMQEDRNTCSCPDDEWWYAGALEHFLMTPTDAFRQSRKSSSSSSTCFTSSALSPPSSSPSWHGTDAESVVTAARQSFIPFGKWYRTQDKKTRERDGCWNANPTNAITGGGRGSNSQHCWYYYPYKPAHVSRQAAEQKRLYGVPDIRCLFADRSAFRVQTPRTKVKTVSRPDGSIVHKSTAYKCKFVPLARLHENNRLYGPILSSLPVVVSSMNLIYSL